MTMTDYSPADEPMIEDMTYVPAGPVTVDVDGSLTGCRSCGRAFGRMQSRVAYVVMGELHFRHADGLC